MAPQEINFDLSVGHSDGDQPVAWNRRDLLLYAVGIGSPPEALDYIYEISPGFRPFPTYPLVLGLKGTSSEVNVFSEMISSRQGVPGFPKLDPNTVVHGEQSIEILHGIPPTSGEGWKIRKRIVGVHDKGSGLILETEQQLVSPVGRTHAIMIGSAFYRGGGQGTGFSKAIVKKPPVVKPPSRAADFQQKDKTTESQAAIYRLSSDYNPLHIDPQIGAKGGLGGTILHGLCSYGFAARALLRSVVPTDGKPGSPAAELKVMSARFTSPVKPGEELETSVWFLNEKDGDVEIAFEQSVVGGKKSLGGGYAVVVKGSKPASFKL